VEEEREVVGAEEKGKREKRKRGEWLGGKRGKGMGWEERGEGSVGICGTYRCIIMCLFI